MSDAITRAIDDLLDASRDMDACYRIWMDAERPEPTFGAWKKSQESFLSSRAALLAVVDPERIARLEAVADFEKTVVSWQSQTFPDATRKSVLRHLSEEAGELQHAWAMRSEDNVREEIGDIGLLLICLASMFGTTLERCMADKFATASRRIYAYDPELGYARHVDAQRAPDAAPGEDGR